MTRRLLSTLCVALLATLVGLDASGNPVYAWGNQWEHSRHYYRYGGYQRHWEHHWGYRYHYEWHSRFHRGPVWYGYGDDHFHRHWHSW